MCVGHMYSRLRYRQKLRTVSSRSLYFLKQVVAMAGEGGGIEVAWPDEASSIRASKDNLKHAPLKVFLVRAYDSGVADLLFRFPS